MDCFGSRGGFFSGRQVPVANTAALLLGAGLALAAEPLVNRVSHRLPRGLAAGLGVSVTLVAVAVAVLFVGALAVGQLKKLAGAMPN